MSVNAAQHTGREHPRLLNTTWEKGGVISEHTSSKMFVQCFEAIRLGNIQIIICFYFLTKVRKKQKIYSYFADTFMVFLYLLITLSHEEYQALENTGNTDQSTEQLLHKESKEKFLAHKTD